MRVLYVCRLYSGFEESLKTGTWNPKGAPTIARMIEHLDHSDRHDFSVILTQKGTAPNSPLKPTQTVSVKGLNKPTTLLGGPNIFPTWLWKFQEKCSDTLQLIQIYRAYRQFKPDIIYCDRVNILPAAILSRFTKARVIWRVMGVLEQMHSASNQNTLRAKISQYLWHSPFKSVICTLDGSGGGPWMEKTLNPKTARHLLINGIQKGQTPDTSIPLPENGTKALFVGRLESLKGIEEFMDAFYDAAKQNNDLHAVIAGDGSLKEQLIQQAKTHNLSDRTHFLGSITQAQLKYVRQNCEFYVSLNKQGNLSNVNLEALSDGLPTIIPSSQPERGIDVDTDNLVPNDTFYRFGKVGDKDTLIKAMLFMTNSENRNTFKENAKKTADKILPTWEERIQQELKIFDDVINDQYDTTIVIADLGSGGAQKVATSLATDLSNQDKKISVITLSDDQNDFFKLPENITRIALNQNKESKTALHGIWANITRIRALRRAIKSVQPKTTISFIAPTNILTIAASIGLNTKTIISERNDPARQSFGKLWDSLRKITYRFASAVTANSPNAVESLKSYVPHKKLKFVPNALPKPDEKHILPHNKKKNEVLIVGRLHPQKDHKTMLTAFAQIHKKHPNWTLVIVGDGKLRNTLEDQAKALGITQKTRFTGTQANPYEYYKTAKIFVLPSLHEGTPNTLLEAMSCGLAPIVSDACEGARPYIQHEQSGLITPVKNAELLAKAIETLINDSEKCETIGKEAQNRVKTLYEKTTVDLWHDVLENKK